MLKIVYDPTTPITLKFISQQYNLIISYMKLVTEFVSVDGLEYLSEERNSQICFDSRACGLAEVHA